MRVTNGLIRTGARVAPPAENVELQEVARSGGHRASFQRDFNVLNCCGWGHVGTPAPRVQNDNLQNCSNAPPNRLLTSRSISLSDVIQPVWQRFQYLSIRASVISRRECCHL